MHIFFPFLTYDSVTFYMYFCLMNKDFYYLIYFYLPLGHYIIMRFRYNMHRTALLAFAMMGIIVLGLVAEKGVEAQFCRDSDPRRGLNCGKRNKMKKAGVKFDKEVSDVQTKR